MNMNMFMNTNVFLSGWHWDSISLREIDFKPVLDNISVTGLLLALVAIITILAIYGYIILLSDNQENQQFREALNFLSLQLPGGRLSQEETPITYKLAIQAVTNRVRLLNRLDTINYKEFNTPSTAALNLEERIKFSEYLRVSPARCLYTIDPVLGTVRNSLFQTIVYSDLTIVVNVAKVETAVRAGRA